MHLQLYLIFVYEVKSYSIPYFLHLNSKNSSGNSDFSMANAALLNSAIGHNTKDINENPEENDENKSNIFTVVAAETLMSTIRPAMEHVLW